MNTEIFNAIAPRYDMTNRVLSWGMDISWRRRMTDFLPCRENLRVLDLATGTGDVAMALGRDRRVAEVIGIDTAQGMLDVGAKKVVSAGLSSRITLRRADAMALDLPDNRFDAVTVAFGLRNFPDLMKGIMEALRVLKPGGRFIVLEFASSSTGWSRYCHGLYVHTVVPALGTLLTGKAAAYRYLSSSIAAFPYGKRFARIMAQTGFEKVECHPLVLGAAMIYAGQKKIW